MFNSVVAIYRDIQTARYKNKRFKVTLQEYFAIRMTVLPTSRFAGSCLLRRLADKCPAGAKTVILCLLGLFLTFSKELSTCFTSQCFI